MIQENHTCPYRRLRIPVRRYLKAPHTVPHNAHAFVEALLEKYLELASLEEPGTPFPSNSGPRVLPSSEEETSGELAKVTNAIVCVCKAKMAVAEHIANLGYALTCCRWQHLVAFALGT